MSWRQQASWVRRLSVIESVSSRDIAGSAVDDDGNTAVESKDASSSDTSPCPSSYPSTPRPLLVPRRMASLNSDRPTSLRFEDDVDHRNRDIKKRDTIGSSDGSKPGASQILHPCQQDPFAQDHEGDVQYRTMAWWQAGMVMIAETVSLGVLSLPSALSTLGLFPGLTLVVTLGLLSTYTGYVIGQFKLRHPHIHSMADAGDVLFGRVGGEILGVGQLLFVIFIMGSHLLTFSIAMNALTSHAACTVAFVAAGAVLSFVLTIPRTLKYLSWWSITSFISITAAVLITMIGVSMSSSSGKARIPGEISLWPSPQTPFHTAFLAVTNIVFAYAGHVAFFTFISELRHPQEFPKALCLLQGCDVCIYVVSSVVIYYYAGKHVKSPALDSAGEVIRSVAYGVAIPTIVVAGVVNGHIAVKYLYVRLLRNGKHGNKNSSSSSSSSNKNEKSTEGAKRKANLMYQNSFTARGIWIAINAALWFLAWVIAEGVPVFNDLLGLTSALFASWFTFGLSGFFWLSLNKCQGDGSPWWKAWSWLFEDRGWRKKVGATIAMGLILLGASICIVGLYASSISIRENNLNHTAGSSFSCADNSRSTKIVDDFDGDKAAGAG